MISAIRFGSVNTKQNLNTSHKNSFKRSELQPDKDSFSLSEQPVKINGEKYDFVSDSVLRRVELINMQITETPMGFAKKKHHIAIKSKDESGQITLKKILNSGPEISIKKSNEGKFLTLRVKDKGVLEIAEISYGDWNDNGKIVKKKELTAKSNGINDETLKNYLDLFIIGNLLTERQEKMLKIKDIVLNLSDQNPKLGAYEIEKIMKEQGTPAPVSNIIYVRNKNDRADYQDRIAAAKRSGHLRRNYKKDPERKQRATHVRTFTEKETKTVRNIVADHPEFGLTNIKNEANEFGVKLSRGEINLLLEKEKLKTIEQKFEHAKKNGNLPEDCDIDSIKRLHSQTTPIETEQAILRLTKENPKAGAYTIVSKLLEEDISVSIKTVYNTWKRNSISPQKKKGTNPSSANISFKGKTDDHEGIPKKHEKTSTPIANFLGEIEDEIRETPFCPPTTKNNITTSKYTNEYDQVVLTKEIENGPKITVKKLNIGKVLTIQIVDKDINESLEVNYASWQGLADKSKLHLRGGISRHTPNYNEDILKKYFKIFFGFDDDSPTGLPKKKTINYTRNEADNTARQKAAPHHKPVIKEEKPNRVRDIELENKINYDVTKIRTQKSSSAEKEQEVLNEIARNPKMGIWKICQELKLKGKNVLPGYASKVRTKHKLADEGKRLEFSEKMKKEHPEIFLENNESPNKIEEEISQKNAIHSLLQQKVIQATHENPKLDSEELSRHFKQQNQLFSISPEGIEEIWAENGIKIKTRKKNRICKFLGCTRSDYIKFEKAYNAYKKEHEILYTKRTFSAKNIEPELADAVLYITAKNPKLSPQSVANEIQERGREISKNEVFLVWWRNGIEKSGPKNAFAEMISNYD